LLKQLVIQNLRDTVIKVALKATYENETVTLEDVCFKPLAPDNNKCSTQSVLEYWQKNHTNIDNLFFV
jgi:Niemann-Pick C1 protein